MWIVVLVLLIWIGAMTVGGVAGMERERELREALAESEGRNKVLQQRVVDVSYRFTVLAELCDQVAADNEEMAQRLSHSESPAVVRKPRHDGSGPN